MEQKVVQAVDVNPLVHGVRIGELIWLFIYNNGKARKRDCQVLLVKPPTTLVSAIMWSIDVVT